MATDKQVILLEFNELTPTLMDQFIGEGHLPNFARLRSESQLFTTDAGEQQADLEPWIQWVTVHTGLPFREHGVVNLDEGHKLAAKRVWDVLSDAGHEVFVCGSMNVGNSDRLRGAVVPDPWCTHVPPTPDDFSLYFRFVQQNVLEYSNSRVPLSKADYARFVKFMALNGLSVDTTLAILRQLGAERGGQHHWRRAVLLDRLQFDLFRGHFKKHRPAFSTFFLNSTAHFQHSYWRSMEPEVFTVKPSAAEQAEYESAILFGYQKMDEIVGRFLQLAGRDVTLVFCTALSQQPCVKYDAQGGAVFYRPTDFSTVARFAGLPAGAHAAPVMTHQYAIDFATEQEARDGARRLQALHVDGRPALSADRTGTRVMTGCQVYTHIDNDAVLSIPDSDRSVPFYSLFYKLDTMKSGMHHPDGMLWIRTPKRMHAIANERVPLSSVAPTLLDLFEVQRPAAMKSAPLSLAK